MADCLSALRNFAVGKKLHQIEEDDEYIVLGEFAWDKLAKTNYLIWGTGRDGEKKEYYNLQALLFFLKNIDLPHSNYVKLAVAANIQHVRFPDRRETMNFLEGERATVPSIDKSAPLAVPVQRPVKGRKAADDIAEVERKRPRMEEAEILRDKELFAAKLDAQRGGDSALVTEEDMKQSGLREALSLEKIAEIKAKRIAKKRDQIKGVDDLNLEQPNQRSYVQLDIDVTRDIISRERNWRTRTTILQSSGKEYGNNIIAMLQSLKSREDGRRSGAVPSSQTPSSAAVRAQEPVTTPKPQSAALPYSRYDQEKFSRREEETEGFKIDTTLTYHGKNLRTVTADAPSSSSAPPSASSSADPRGATGNQKPVVSYNPMPIKPRMPPPSSSAKKASRTPIIIIPAALTSLITIFNCKDLLQDMKFISTEERRSQGAKREQEVLIQRNKEGDTTTTVPYRIVDSIHKLVDTDWDRVVAVFAQGPAWQFKGWPWNGSPTDIFARVKAFHLKWSELPLESNIKNWSVHVLQLDRHKRHLDRAILQQFWELLDKHMMKHKANLRF